MINKWARWLGKTQRPYTFALNEKHVLFEFASIWCSCLTFPPWWARTTPAKGVRASRSRPAVLRQVWGRYEQQLGGLNAGFEAESGYQEHSLLKSYKEQGLPPLEQHVTQQGHGWNSRGHCAELVCNIPSSSYVYMWRRQLGLGKACFSEKVLGPSISHPMSSCISCCSQLVSPRH